MISDTHSWEISHPHSISWIKIIYKSTHDITSIYIDILPGLIIAICPGPRPGPVSVWKYTTYLLINRALRGDNKQQYVQARPLSDFGDIGI